MAEEAASAPEAPMPSVRPASLKIVAPLNKFDVATFAGMLLALSMIGVALALGGNLNSFYDIASILIVIGGTLAVTAISFSGQELRKSLSIFGSTFVKSVRKPSVIARELLDVAVIVRGKGALALSQVESELRKDPFLYQGAMFVADGYTADEIKRILTHDIESLIDRHRRSASIARRAGEVAPAMGLIGTLVGLVQMLNSLDDPSAIGPAMAIALLTTFYGALLSTVFLMPLAAKLERNSADDVMIKDMILAAMISMARKDHPRKLEHELNMLLPPGERVRYFSQ